MLAQQQRGAGFAAGSANTTNAMTYERYVSLSVWACSAVAPLVAACLIVAYGVEPPDWSGYVTLAAIVTWLITAPWGVVRGVTAYQDERRVGGLLVSGASLAAIVLLVILLFAKGILG